MPYCCLSVYDKEFEEEKNKHKISAEVVWGRQRKIDWSSFKKVRNSLKQFNLSKIQFFYRVSQKKGGLANAIAFASLLIWYGTKKIHF